MLSMCTDVLVLKYRFSVLVLVSKVFVLDGRVLSLTLELCLLVFMKWLGTKSFTILCSHTQRCGFPVFLLVPVRGNWHKNYFSSWISRLFILTTRTLLE